MGVGGTHRARLRRVSPSPTTSTGGRCAGRDRRPSDHSSRSHSSNFGVTAMSASIPISSAPDSLLGLRGKASDALISEPVARSAGSGFRLFWFALLLSAICLEGLGRRYLPSVPSTVFYFFKDAVLIVGLI